MLTVVSDLAPSAWIEAGKLPAPGPGAPCLVGNCIPSGFEAYVKLLHPIYVDPTIKDHATSWHSAEQRDTGAPGILSTGTLVRESSYGRAKGERLRWEDLANRYGLTFHADVNDGSFTRYFSDRSWPRYLLGPDEGTLDPETCRELAAVLAPATLSQSVFFYYAGLSVQGYEPRMYLGKLRDVMEFFEMNEDLLATPEYWWPESREWCVCTDWDLSFTLIGGSEETIRTISRSPILETLTVTPNSRVDWHADEVNKGLGNQI